MRTVPQENLRDRDTEADLLAAALKGDGGRRTAVVEVMGFEPTASSMRPKRSPAIAGR